MHSQQCCWLLRLVDSLGSLDGRSGDWGVARWYSNPRSTGTDSTFSLFPTLPNCVQRCKFKCRLAVRVTKTQNDRMSVQEPHEHPDAPGAEHSGMDASLYYRFRMPDSKLPVVVPIVNIDSENYMLRGISPAPEQRPRSFSLSGYTSNSKSQQEKDIDIDMLVLPDSTDTDVVPNSTYCARAISFHSLLCSCRMSCCCMCGILCSPDCHTCFHKLCVGFAANYACKKNADKPATLATYSTEKVSRIFWSKLYT